MSNENVSQDLTVQVPATIVDGMLEVLDVLESLTAGAEPAVPFVQQRQAWQQARTSNVAQVSIDELAGFRRFVGGALRGASSHLQPDQHRTLAADVAGLISAVSRIDRNSVRMVTV